MRPLFTTLLAFVLTGWTLMGSALTTSDQDVFVPLQPKSDWLYSTTAVHTPSRSIFLEVREVFLVEEDDDTSGTRKYMRGHAPVSVLYSLTPIPLASSRQSVSTPRSFIDRQQPVPFFLLHSVLRL